MDFNKDNETEKLNKEIEKYIAKIKGKHKTKKKYFLNNIFVFCFALFYFFCALYQNY
jgi:hypothetical protein